jgi:oligopeptide transport system ATP-binding protein
VGESGCGKTTTARAILQLAAPDGGLGDAQGQEWWGKTLRGEALRRIRTQMQIIFQNPYSSLNPRMTIGRTLTEPMTGARDRERGKDRRGNAPVELLQSRVGLNPYFVNRFPSEFSGGQRQRIGIARALSVGTRISSSAMSPSRRWMSRSRRRS